MKNPRDRSSAGSLGLAVMRFRPPPGPEGASQGAVYPAKMGRASSQSWVLYLSDGPSRRKPGGGGGGGGEHPITPSSLRPVSCYGTPLATEACKRKSYSNTCWTDKEDLLRIIAVGVNKTIAVEEMDRAHLGIQQRQLGIYNQGTELGVGGDQWMEQC